MQACTDEVFRAFSQHIDTCLGESLPKASGDVPESQPSHECMTRRDAWQILRCMRPRMLASAFPSRITDIDVGVRLDQGRTVKNWRLCMWGLAQEADRPRKGVEKATMPEAVLAGVGQNSPKTLKTCTHLFYSVSSCHEMAPTHDDV